MVNPRNPAPIGGSGLILERIGAWHDADQIEPDRRISPLRPHDIRHTFAFSLSERRAPTPTNWSAALATAPSATSPATRTRPKRSPQATSRRCDAARRLRLVTRFLGAPLVGGGPGLVGDGVAQSDVAARGVGVGVGPRGDGRAPGAGGGDRGFPLGGVVAQDRPRRALRRRDSGQPPCGDCRWVRDPGRKRRPTSGAGETVGDSRSRP